MRILKLTDAVARRISSRGAVRTMRPPSGLRAKILADVRDNGDAALFRWA